MEKYEIYLTLSNRLHLQSTIFYQRYVETFKTSELGRIKSHLPLREMAMSFGLIEEKPKSIRVKRGGKPFFTPECMVALVFLNIYTGFSAPKLLEAKHPLSDLLQNQDQP